MLFFIRRRNINIPPTSRNFSEKSTEIKQAEVQPPSEVSVILVGDIMLSRNVGTKILQAHNPDLPFLNLENFLRSADVTFGNLEAPFCETGLPVKEGMVFKVEKNYVQGLIAAGFDIVSTANNHASDCAAAGIKLTKNWLLENNILSVGTGENETESHQPQILEVNGQKIGFLAYNYFKRPPYIADMNMEKMETDIQNLKSKSDFVIVSVHAGTEYTPAPNAQQTSFNRAAIEAGADVVVGHHPHWIQTIEKYRQGIIFYSLGNFIFDQGWSQKTKEGLVIELKIEDKKLKSAELHPIIIENNCCARPADESETQNILQNVNITSTIIKL